VDEEHFRRRSARALLCERVGQPLHGGGHGRGYGFARFAFDEPDRSAAPRHKEVDFQPLFVAEVIDFGAAGAIDLSFHDFRSDETLEERPEKRRLRQFRGRLDAEQVTRQAGILGDLMSLFPKFS